MYRQNGGPTHFFLKKFYLIKEFYEQFWSLKWEKLTLLEFLQRGRHNYYVALLGGGSYEQMFIHPR